jgi:hypothetical protein
MYREHHDRICSVTQMWASGHFTDYRLVSIVRNGKPKRVAGCSIGYAMTDTPCPDSFAAPHAPGEPATHCTTNPDVRAGFEPLPDSKKLWKYDPDLGRWQYDQSWMNACLFAPVFPTPDLSRYNSWDRVRTKEGRPIAPG